MKIYYLLLGLIAITSLTLTTAVTPIREPNGIVLCEDTDQFINGNVTGWVHDDWLPSAMNYTINSINGSGDCFGIVMNDCEYSASGCNNRGRYTGTNRKVNRANHQYDDDNSC